MKDELMQNMLGKDTLQDIVTETHLNQQIKKKTSTALIMDN